MRSEWLRIVLVLLLPATLQAYEVDERWKLADPRSDGKAELTLFVEVERTEGRPAFKIETTFAVSPFVAATTLMEGMLSASDVPSGQRRRVLERSEREAVVYTFIDLPFMLSDRELALRVVHSEDRETAIHRIDWVEANEMLPAVQDGVVRLNGATGYWEFRPDGKGGTFATHMTQTEIGGSIPNAIGYRLMKSQALGTVDRLRSRLRTRQRTHVAGSPDTPQAKDQ